MSKSTKSAASTTPCLKEFFDPESKKRALSVIEQKKKELIALADAAGVGMGIMVASEGEVTEVLASPVGVKMLYIEKKSIHLIKRGNFH